MEYIKVLGPVILGIVALFTTYYSITLQINKNRRVKWIDDFRNHVAEYLTLLITVKNAQLKNEEVLRPIRKTNFLIRLYLDLKDSDHLALSIEMEEIAYILGNVPFDTKNFEQHHTNISIIAREIVEKETNKLANIFR